MKRPRADFWDDPTPFLPNLQVFEDEGKPVDTGLLNADGTRIFRHSAKRPIGFDLTPRQKA